MFFHHWIIHPTMSTFIEESINQTSDQKKVAPKRYNALETSNPDFSKILSLYHLLYTDRQRELPSFATFADSFFKKKEKIAGFNAERSGKLQELDSQFSDGRITRQEYTKLSKQINDDYDASIEAIKRGHRLQREQQWKRYNDNNMTELIDVFIQLLTYRVLEYTTREEYPFSNAFGDNPEYCFYDHYTTYKPNLHLKKNINEATGKDAGYFLSIVDTIEWIDTCKPYFVRLLKRVQLDQPLPIPVQSYAFAASAQASPTGQSALPTGQQMPPRVMRQSAAPIAQPIVLHFP